MDYSIRIPATKDRISILEKQSKTRKELSRVKDILFKPKNASLTDFHPNKIAIRLREFIEEDIPSSLVKIETIKTDTGYTDTKEKIGKGQTEELLKIAKRLGYEKWGELSMYTVEYDTGFAQALLQNIEPVGQMIKIESETQKGLNKTLDLLNASKEEKISKNAGVLLGEKLNLV